MDSITANVINWSVRDHIVKDAPCLVCGEDGFVEKWENPARICDKCKAAIMKMREDS